jgi:hypothetical protein
MRRRTSAGSTSVFQIRVTCSTCRRASGASCWSRRESPSGKCTSSLATRWAAHARTCIRSQCAIEFSGTLTSIAEGELDYEDERDTQLGVLVIDSSTSVATARPLHTSQTQCVTRRRPDSLPTADSDDWIVRKCQNQLGAYTNRAASILENDLDAHLSISSALRSHPRCRWHRTRPRAGGLRGALLLALLNAFAPCMACDTFGPKPERCPHGTLRTRDDFCVPAGSAPRPIDVAAPSVEGAAGAAASPSHNNGTRSRTDS